MVHAHHHKNSQSCPASTCNTTRSVSRSTPPASYFFVKLAPKAQVVKAFNTIFASLLAPEAREGKVLQVFIAGDADTAKASVAELATSIGFDGVDAGPLSNSRFIEPIGEMNIHFGYFLGKGPAVAPVWVQV